MAQRNQLMGFPVGVGRHIESPQIIRSAPAQRVLMPMQPSYEGQVSQNSRLDRIERAVDRLAQATHGGTGSAFDDSPVYLPEYRHGLSVLASPETVGKGGINRSSSVTFGAGDEAGTTATATFGSDAISRMSGMLLTLLSAAPTGQLNDPEELSKILATLKISQAQVPRAFEIPLDLISWDLDGDADFLEVNEMVGSDATIEIELEVVDDLATTASTTVSFRAWSGSRPVKLHYPG